MQKSFALHLYLWYIGRLRMFGLYSNTSSLMSNVSNSLYAFTHFESCSTTPVSFVLFCFFHIIFTVTHEVKRTTCHFPMCKVCLCSLYLDGQMPQCRQGPIDVAQTAFSRQLIPAVLLCFCWLKTRATVALVAVVASHNDAEGGGDAPRHISMKDSCWWST